MKIGMVGLGKLGLPCLLAMETKGHEVAGWDTNPDPRIEQGGGYDGEAGVDELLAKSKIRLLPPQELREWADIVFVAVQTPHEYRFEGTMPLSTDRADFYYGFLREAVKSVDGAKRIVVISTVLPGTMERDILPGIKSPVSYNPYFIAMGTCIADFLNPEFTLIGNCCDALLDFYETIHSKPVFMTSIRTAELIKVVYNTFISTKIGFINSVMEMCEKLGCNVDHVSDALALATDRIISPKYMRGGMGDGGGCHPRDNIAMSWLAQRLKLSWDWFGSVMIARECQTRWLAQEAIREASIREFPIRIVGAEFKADTLIGTGSAAMLLLRLLTPTHQGHDPCSGMPVSVTPRPELAIDSGPAVFVIGCNHSRYKDAKFPEGSVVIDPWGYIPDQPGVTVRRIGRCEQP